MLIPQEKQFLYCLENTKLYVCPPCGLINKNVDRINLPLFKQLNLSVNILVQFVSCAAEAHDRGTANVRSGKKKYVRPESGIKTKVIHSYYSLKTSL